MQVIVHPSEKEIEAARRLSDALDALRQDIARLAPPADVRLSALNELRLPALDELRLPPSMVQLLIDVLQEIAGGHGVAVQRLDDRELTTREAADVLGVSRPTLIGMLERGEIPYHRVGTHRRVRQQDVFAYRTAMEREGRRPDRRTKEERLRALQKMAESTEALGLGY